MKLTPPSLTTDAFVVSSISLFYPSLLHKSSLHDENKFPNNTSQEPSTNYACVITLCILNILSRQRKNDNNKYEENERSAEKKQYDDDVDIEECTKHTQYTHQQTGTSNCQFRHLKILHSRRHRRDWDQREKEKSKSWKTAWQNVQFKWHNDIKCSVVLVPRCMCAS